MKIVVLDGYTINPGDLSWNALEQLGNLSCYDRSTPEEIVERGKEAEILLLNKAPVTAATLSQFPKLKYIGVIATGVNSVDIDAARARNIPVCNVPAYGSASVAQHAFALLLELTNKTGAYAASTARGEWASAKDWTYSIGGLTELQGKIMGIVGLGDIGQQTAQLARAFGMEILGNKRNMEEPIEGVDLIPVEELFSKSDVVSLHCPLTEENYQFVNGVLLEKMKPTAYLINTARGGLIDENALAKHLRKGTIAGAGLDVLSTEPPNADNPLLSAPNCLISPHIAWATLEARTRLMDMVVENVRAFMAGKPQNVVN